MSTIAKNKGSLLIEVLISIALFLAISTIIAEALFASFYGSRDSENKMSINSLISEQNSNIRALSDEHWSNIGSLVRDADYHIATSTSGLKVATGVFEGVSNGIDYKLSFKIKDAQRSLMSTSTALSLASSTGLKADDATLVITSTGIMKGKNPIIIQTILTRWRNIVCSQGRFDSTNTNVAPCETNNIYMENKVNIETGDQIKLCNGCK